jgi:hypothetical protein
VQRAEPPPPPAAAAAAAAAGAGMTQQARDRVHNEAVMAGVDPHALLLQRAGEPGSGKRGR